jgi:hypothetical protein
LNRKERTRVRASATAATWSASMLGAPCGKSARPRWGGEDEEGGGDAVAGARGCRPDQRRPHRRRGNRVGETSRDHGRGAEPRDRLAFGLAAADAGSGDLVGGCLQMLGGLVEQAAARRPPAAACRRARRENGRSRCRSRRSREDASSLRTKLRHSDS